MFDLFGVEGRDYREGLSAVKRLSKNNSDASSGLL
jgi:hypothetical protein